MKFIRRLSTLLVCWLCLMPFPLHLHCQTVQWTQKLEPGAGDTCVLRLEASIPAGWHMYDLGPYASDGPYATAISAVPDPQVALLGPPVPLSPAVRRYDAVFGCEIGYYEHVAAFELRFVCPAPPVRFGVEVSWMLCDATRCMSPRDTLLRVEVGDVSTLASLPDAGRSRPAVAFNMSGMVQDYQAGTSDQTALVSTDTVQPAPYRADGTPDTSMPFRWSLLLEALLWGLAAILTPCVFPMVPMTVSLFLRQTSSPQANRLRAVLYGVFIVLIYTVPIALAVLAGHVFGRQTLTPDTLNWLSTHWIPNVLFFVVFMLFAASFFGAFNLTLPSRWVNAADRQGGRTGLSAVFFMALTLVLVSFSCTGPIVGTVLINSFSGHFWMPVLTMAVFSVTFALPFTLFALFPSWLVRMPRSGAWLQTVKVSIAFVELAFGFKFLSVADQTYHWHILPRPVYLAIWVTVAVLWSLYLFGVYSRRSKPGRLSAARKCMAVMVLLFAVALLPGFRGAPLRLLSGYLPPMPATARMSAVAGFPEDVKYADRLSLPHGLQGFFSLEQAQAYAAKVQKPLFIDFTGHGCVNCREMEARVWSDAEALELLKTHFVVVALYVDDRTEADPADWVELPDRTLRTMGRINAWKAFSQYGISAEPAYVVQSPDGRVLLPTYGYNLRTADFTAFLKQALELSAAAGK